MCILMIYSVILSCFSLAKLPTASRPLGPLASKDFPDASSSRGCHSVGNPGCHKPTMTGDG